MSSPLPLVTVSQVLSGIFSEMRNERFTHRRFPRPTATFTATTTNTNKPTKRMKGEPPVILPMPEVIRCISEFLNPFELQSWSCCCKATREACTAAVQLDALFSQFRILKRHADHLQTAHEDCDWKVVIYLLLQALQKLHSVYGPYNVHPLHMAVVGEILMVHLAKREHSPDGDTLLEDVWNADDIIDGCLSSPFVLGGDDDYFYDLDDMELFREFVADNVEEFPSGPARILAREGRMPFINVFTREDESHSDQMGFFFPNYNDSSAKSDDNLDDTAIPQQIFCMNLQEMPDDVETYTGLDKYNDCHSIGEAFCQYFPLPDGCWDDWTQLLRAGWMKAHRLAPFDQTSHGNMLWERVIESVGHGELKLEKSVDRDDEDNMGPQVLNIDEHQYQEAEDRAKEYALIYLRLNHVVARGSDYI